LTVSLTGRKRPCRVNRRGAVAQLGECLTGSQEVASSILASSTNRINNLPKSQKIPPNVVYGDFPKPPAIDYDNPQHEHDAPREEIYEELPFFDQFRVPAGKPDEVQHDGVRSVRKVVRHLARGNRYVTRVTGDSMQPRIEDGDLILVDYA
jgi:SOS-response transcriptional repressor LexA